MDSPPTGRKGDPPALGRRFRVGETGRGLGRAANGRTGLPGGGNSSVDPVSVALFPGGTLHDDPGSRHPADCSSRSLDRVRAPAR